MLLPQTKEREYRFRLALRMGLPIFGIIVAFISSTLIDSYHSLSPAFYFVSILLLALCIYFIFFLIYKGFEVKITDYISGVFTREYLYEYLTKEIKSKEQYTLILISIDNLQDINVQYGMANGDRIIKEVINYIVNYFNDKNISSFPLGHLKGGDYIIGLKGSKDEYSTFLDLFCLKSSELKIDNIEISLSGAITDTSYSNDLDYLIENLLELQAENRGKKKADRYSDKINPNDLENYVIEAVKDESVNILTQDVFENGKPVFKECFTKLITRDNRVLHPKSYMKIINKLGLSKEYDLLILRHLLTNYVDERSLVFAINISPVSLRNYTFISKMRELLEQSNHGDDKLIFILSEAEYYTNIKRYNETLQSLRKLGIKIAIDRIGSLHTSFLYLRELDIDIVRFDSLYKDEKYKEVVEGFNHLAHKKGVKTWLKMIEKKETKNFADSIGIDYLQGKELAQLQTIDGEK